MLYITGDSELLTDESASFLPQRGRIRHLDVLRPSRFPEIPPEGPRLRVIRAGDRPEFPQFLRYSVDSCYPAFSPPSLRASFRILTAALKSLS